MTDGLPTLIPDASRTRLFSFRTGLGVEESYLSLEAEPFLSFPQALVNLDHMWSEACSERGLSEKDLVFSRLFVSDIANQKEEVRGSPLFSRLSQAGFSFIEQPPCTGSDLAILAWFLKPAQGNLKKCGPVFRGWGNRLTVEGNHFALEILANEATGSGSSSVQQTTDVFSHLDQTLSEKGWSLLGNTLRTWVFVRDIDNQYQGMTVARKAFFTGRGLTEKTRYIASTGIEARSRDPHELVSLDALSIGGLQAAQIQRMEALQNLCPTSMYGVTFERGTRVRFGDRSHLWVSGTASIDEAGQVLFPTDVVAQTRRTLDNIKALLEPHGATLRDFGHLVVYLRNRNHATGVINVLRERIPESVPLIMVQAAVCRPAWLVEIEGVAVIRDQNPFPSFF